ncbi:MAG TPA: EAL domain-containing protein [Arthrobacter sp.]|nr:EAL domain-containing protein [Arthrobacter sp.]
MVASADRRVLEAAVRQLAQWRADGIVEDDFAVHINLSATELQRLELVDEIRQVLKRHSVPGRNLIIELTETAMVKGNELDRYTLMSLKRLGVGMEIDDFGTGYSSISYLRRLPIDRVKADRSLIGELESDENQQKFVTAIIQLVHACGLDTLFEGIETAQQAEYLKKAGCSAGQGYYFSRPVPSEQFVELFKTAS